MPTILVVDDNRIALMSRRFVLERAGYTVLPATDVPEALDVVHAHAVDVVLMDYYLPSGTGEDARRRMKHIRPGMPILVLSGAAEMPEDLSNIDLFLSKLDGPEHLLEAIRRFVPPGLSNKAA
ncbi:MAG: response regulator [Acidobacteria bacterium]|nr:response regulator [Acidobacteriota bacterium]